MKRLSLFSLFLLSGCYATAEPLYLPDGSAGYHISCGKYIGTMADCIEKSGEMCGPNGYQMYDQTGRPLSAETQNQSVIAALNASAGKHGTSTEAQQNMFIKCKTNDAPLHMTPVPIPPQVEVTPMPLSPAPAQITPSAPVPANNSPIPLR